ncbi:TPA: hypothetical protein ACOEQU_004204 [Stenotrophomonas maltophilia]
MDADDQQTRWLLAQTLEWHRHEQKALWREFFRLSDLNAEDLLNKRAARAGLNFAGAIGS